MTQNIGTNTQSKLTFDDEFNALSLWNGTTGIWDPTYWWASSSGATVASNKELEWYINPGYAPTSSFNPFSVSDGVLTITAKPTPAALTAYVNGQPYVSGVATTYHSFSQTYGYFEMRAQLPAGQGIWPAFWLLPANGSWPPELDVMEMLGNEPSTIYTTAHTDLPSNNTMIQSAVAVSDTSSGFHTYGIDWEPDEIRWYVDGRQVFQTATPADLNTPMYMLVNLAIGGTWPGNPNSSTPFPAQYKIDYIRAYTSKPTFSVSADNSVITSGSAGALIDAQGNSWTITNGGQVAVNGTPDSTTANVVELAYVNGTIWQEDSTHLWREKDTASESWSPAKGTTSGPFASATTSGSGADKLHLRLSEDAWNGNAQFTVTVDGKQVGGVQTVAALHGSGEAEVFSLVGNWGQHLHSVGISFINDATAGTATADRNLYVDSIALDGHTYSGTTAALYSNGMRTFPVGGSTPTTTGPLDGLTLHLSEDAWQGDAEFTVSIDGKMIAAAQAVTALHSLGQTEDFTFAGTLAAGAHVVAVQFVNDAWGGTSAADRNLYVNSVTFDGSNYGTAGVALPSNSTASFNVLSDHP